MNAALDAVMAIAIRLTCAQELLVQAIVRDSLGLASRSARTGSALTHTLNPIQRNATLTIVQMSAVLMGAMGIHGNQADSALQEAVFMIS